jgi:CRISPR-associated protein Cas2
MYILVAYDVNTTTKAGEKRLRRMARACVDFGQRVQYSLFECSVNAMQLEVFRKRLLEIMDAKLDSLRLYHLPGQAEPWCEAFGKERKVDFEGRLVV